MPPGARMSVVSLVCCQVEVSATDRTPVQGSHTDVMCLFVCVCGGGGSWSVIKSTNDPLHLQRISRRVQTETKERKMLMFPRFVPNFEFVDME